MNSSYIKYISPNVTMPKELEEMALNLIGKTDDLQVQYSGKYSKNFQIHILPEIVIQWIKKNIPVTANSNHSDFRIHIIHPGLRLHVDYGRVWAANYILNTGGPRSESVWYDDTRTNKLYGEIVPERTWHLFNTEIQHTVHNIDEDKVRIGITVTVEKKQMPDEIIVLD